MAPPPPQDPSAALQEYLPAFRREDDAFLSYWSVNQDKTVTRSDFTRGEFWALGAAAAGALEEAGLGPGDAAGDERADRFVRAEIDYGN